MITSGAEPHNLTLLGLFFTADPVVQVVMGGLILASIWSWTVIFSKTFLLKRLFKKARRFEDAFWNSRSLEAFHTHLQEISGHPLVYVFAVGFEEWKKTTRRGGGVPEGRTTLLRIERAMSLCAEREILRIEKQIGFLASLGSTAPFIGLFGTVWGIMHSFQSIAAAQTTSLTIVAPAIAEALFATALGLVAAIPSTLAYNKLSGELNRYQTDVDVFITEFIALISRQVQEGGR